MRLYSGLSTDFTRDNVHNRIAEKLMDAPSEVKSWRNSLRAVSQVIDSASLHNHGILLEYQLPMSSKRLDCMITGTDEAQRDNAVILELKQWDNCGDAGAEPVLPRARKGRKLVARGVSARP